MGRGWQQPEPGSLHLPCRGPSPNGLWSMAHLKAPFTQPQAAPQPLMLRACFILWQSFSALIISFDSCKDLENY